MQKVVFDVNFTICYLFQIHSKPSFLALMYIVGDFGEKDDGFESKASKSRAKATQYPQNQVVVHCKIMLNMLSTIQHTVACLGMSQTLSQVSCPRTSLYILLICNIAYRSTFHCGFSCAHMLLLNEFRGLGGHYL